MKKFDLGKEHCDKWVYGDSPIDALERQRVLPVAPTFDKESRTPIEEAPIKIRAVLGTENTNGALRCGKSFTRVICQLEDECVVSVDVFPSTAVITLK